MQTLDGLSKMAREYAVDCFDETVPALGIKYIGNHVLQYAIAPNLFNQNPVAANATMNQYSYGQFNGRVGGPDLRWIGNNDRCPADLEVTIFNRLLEKESVENREYMLRRKGETVRAVLSSDYTVFDNVQFIDLVSRGLDSLGGAIVQVHRPSVDDRLRTYILLPQITFNKDYGGLHPGVYIRNSEVGDGAARITGGLYRSVCSNGIVYGWDAETSAIVRHRYYNSEMLVALVASALAEGLKMSEEAAQKFVASESVHIEKKSLRPLIDGWAEKYGFSKTVTDEWQGMTIGNAGEFGRANDVRMMDVVNGATYLAQRQEDETFAEAIERMAGEILKGVPVNGNNVADYVLLSATAEI